MPASDDHSDDAPYTCVASTALDDRNDSFFKAAEWSQDGTCIVSNNDDNSLRTYVLYAARTVHCLFFSDDPSARPLDLLISNQPHVLSPYAVTSHAEPVHSFTLYPSFTLSDPTTTLVLASTRDHPLSLTNALYSPSTLATYPLIHNPTETWLSASSLAFTPTGSHFLAGHRNTISIFDLSRPSQPPISTISTTPRKPNPRTQSPISTKGTISALAIAPTSELLATGTWQRRIALFSTSSNDLISTWPLDPVISGAGVSSLLWSPCERYLYVAERRSDVLSVFDIRAGNRRLVLLAGRCAHTTQRLGFGLHGYDVWAGGTDGRVRSWHAPHEREGMVEADETWRAHGDAVSATTLHPSGVVAATASGQRHFGDDDDERESTLKIWRL